MRYFYDCEFVDTGSVIDLISIGIVAEDGREFYAQSCEFYASNASPWVAENVLPHLSLCPHVHNSEPSVTADLFSHREHGRCTFVDLEKGIAGECADCPWRTREALKRNILSFMDIETYGKPELWSYYSAYDHVAFCQLFGTMMGLPKGYPMLTYDLRQWLDMHGMQDVRQPDDSTHNALLDARWVAETYRRLVK